jgi:hypothetical protein
MKVAPGTSRGFLCLVFDHPPALASTVGALYNDN